MIAKTPFEADHKRIKAEAIVKESSLSIIISSMYVLKNELTTSGANSFAMPANEDVVAPICFSSESESITSGISDMNIKNAVCAEYAPIRLAAALRVRYLIFLNIVFTVNNPFFAKMR
jgi:hypothetical protein